MATTTPLTGEGACRRRDTLDDTGEVSDDAMLGDTNDVPAAAAERTIARSIMTLTPVMRAAIDFHREPDLGASKVDDVIPDDELATERETRLGPGELAPEPLF